MRRRPSTDFISLTTTGLGERPKLAPGASSPMRERIGGFMGRRRDSTGTNSVQFPMTILTRE